MLTKITGSPDRTKVIPGMAHFAGTGPRGALCAACMYWNRTNVSKNGAACRKYVELMRQVAAANKKRLVEQRVPGSTAACRHFEEWKNQ